ncbi:MAG: arginine--tRNA ligase, partial [Pseudomonadota bacterium]|nr:arginine--tRNA ligase [Pseudomonadota bacterium]
MNLFSDFEGRIKAVVRDLLGDPGADPALLDRINAEPPRDPAHGDVATNAAMILAKPLGVKPRELAMRIAARLEADPDVASVQV